MSSTTTPSSSEVAADVVAELSDGGGGGGGDDDNCSSERDEVQEISDDIRRAIECPVCLLLSPNLTCICPNGHHTCISCVDQLFNNNPLHGCPLCRSPLINTVEVSPTELKLAEWMSVVRVACAHRRFGCDRFITVHETVEHEPQCAHKPDVQCLVSACPWIGVYRQLYNHVSNRHPHVANERPVWSLSHNIIIIIIVTLVLPLVIAVFFQIFGTFCTELGKLITITH